MWQTEYKGKKNFWAFLEDCHSQSVRVWKPIVPLHPEEIIDFLSRLFRTLVLPKTETATSNKKVHEGILLSCPSKCLKYIYCQSKKSKFIILKFTFWIFFVPFLLCLLFSYHFFTWNYIWIFLKNVMANRLTWSIKTEMHQYISKRI